MVFLVVIQKSKGGGLATNLQSSQALAQQMGMRRATDFVEKATWYVMGFIAIAAFVAGISISNEAPQQGGFNLRTSEALQNAAPTLPPAPAGAPTLMPAEGDAAQPQQ